MGPTEVIQKQEEISQEAVSLAGQIRSLVVTNQETYDKMNSLIAICKTAQKKVTGWFAPMKSKAYDSWKQICKQESDVLGPLQIAEKNGKFIATSWWQEQEEKRLAVERKLREEAEEKAQKEREKLQRKAEKEAAKGNEAEAEALKEQAESVQAVDIVVKPQVEKNNGVSYRELWYAEVTDMKLLCKEIAEGRISPNVVKPNQTALDGLARANEDTLTIPGVAFKKELSQSNRI